MSHFRFLIFPYFFLFPRQIAIWLCTTCQRVGSLYGRRPDHTCRFYVNSIGYPSESVSSSKWHVWFASRCSGRRLDLYLADDCCLVSDSSLRSADVPTCVVPRTLSSYGDRSFICSRWTSLVELFRSSCPIQTSPTDCSDNKLKGHLFGKHEYGALWLLIYGALEKNTYLLSKPGPTMILLHLILC